MNANRLYYGSFNPIGSPGRSEGMDAPIPNSFFHRHCRAGQCAPLT
ncbi:MAG: hypothetical protein AB1453_01050 [Chloroflexota bacterium]